jgi:hypothetical protein
MPVDAHRAEDLRGLDEYRLGRPGNFVSGRAPQADSSIVPRSLHLDAPVAGATVTIWNNATERTAETNGDGELRLENLPPGECAVAARRAAYTPLRESEQVNVPAWGRVQALPRLNAAAGPVAAQEQRRRVVRPQPLPSHQQCQGRVPVFDLPAGDYLLGHEIWHDKPSAREP